MRHIASTLVFLLLTISGFSQMRVALHSADTTIIVGGSSPFITAYNLALDGDTIYLPGGSMAAPSSFAKHLTVFGVGHYPDSTAATSSTVVNGNIQFVDGADSSFFEGINFTGSFSVANNHKVDNLCLSRCRFNSITYTGNLSTPCENNEIRQCVFTSGNLQNASNCLITNSIITGTLSNGVNNAVYNNTFLYSNSYSSLINNMDNSAILNNVFNNTGGVQIYCESSIFYNNVFAGTATVGSNTFSGNYENVTMSGFFVNLTSSSFDYAADYHLSNAASYLGADGTQVGIYGGFHPYKEGAVPMNPHIVIKNIPLYTDSVGQLPVHIKVRAEQQ